MNLQKILAQYEPPGITAGTVVAGPEASLCWSQGWSFLLDCWLHGTGEQWEEGFLILYTEVLKFLVLSRSKQDFPERFILRGSNIEAEQKNVRRKHYVMGEQRETLP